LETSAVAAPMAKPADVLTRLPLNMNSLISSKKFFIRFSDNATRI
jgi:hypothetical protein